MKEAAIIAPPDVENEPVGKGLSDFKSKNEKIRQKFKENSQQNKTKKPKSREKNFETIKNEAIKFLFGRD